jgi:hypothetical protein
MQRSLNLCLHAGANQATFDQVRAVATPEPTETWCPIAHHHLIETVLATLERGGLRVVAEAHGLWHDGLRYFGSFQLANGVDHEDYALVLGLRNSHDKKFPAGLACGSGVFVCDNLAFSGEIKLSRKHTARIKEDLPRLITSAVGRLGTMRANQDRRIACYKEKAVSDAQAHDLIVRAIDSKALPVTRLPAVLSEWRKPKHEAFAPRTAWSLFNAFTEDLKLSSTAVLSARSIPLHGLFDQLCGIRHEDQEQFADATIEGGEPALAV